MSSYVTVIEKLEAFPLRCRFRQNNPSNPAKYLTKIISMVDSNDFFTSNMEAYVGGQPDGRYKSGTAQVMTLNVCVVTYQELDGT